MVSSPFWCVALSPTSAEYPAKNISSLKWARLAMFAILFVNPGRMDSIVVHCNTLFLSISLEKDAGNSCTYASLYSLYFIKRDRTCLDGSQEDPSSSLLFAKFFLPLAFWIAWWKFFSEHLVWAHNGRRASASLLRSEKNKRPVARSIAVYNWFID